MQGRWACKVTFDGPKPVAIQTVQIDGLVLKPWERLMCPRCLALLELLEGDWAHDEPMCTPFDIREFFFRLKRHLPDGFLDFDLSNEASWQPSEIESLVRRRSSHRATPVVAATVGELEECWNKLGEEIHEHPFFLLKSGATTWRELFVSDSAIGAVETGDRRVFYGPLYMPGNPLLLRSGLEVRLPDSDNHDELVALRDSHATTTVYVLGEKLMNPFTRNHEIHVESWRHIHIAHDEPRT